MPRRPDNGEGRAPRQRPGPASTFTATNGTAILPDQGDGWWWGRWRLWTWEVAEQSRWAA
jgi:hypothetical protein